MHSPRTVSPRISSHSLLRKLTNPASPFPRSGGKFEARLMYRIQARARFAVEIVEPSEGGVWGLGVWRGLEQHAQHLARRTPRSCGGNFRRQSRKNFAIFRRCDGQELGQLICRPNFRLAGFSPRRGAILRHRQQDAGETCGAQVWTSRERIAALNRTFREI